MISSAAMVGATGWLGQLFGEAILEQKLLQAERLTCVNRSGRSRGYERWPEITWSSNFQGEGLNNRTWSSNFQGEGLNNRTDIVIFSLRPNQFRSGLFCCKNSLVLSFMTGVTLQELSKHTGSNRIIRAMPNVAIELRKSYTPWVASPTTTPSDRDLAVRLLRTVGTEQEVASENALNILTGLSGAGPAYTSLLIRGLSDAAVQLGLDPEIAEQAALSTVLDSAGMLSSGNSKPEAIVNKFIEYDGVIAAGLNAAVQGGFDFSLKQALAAATDKVNALEADFSCNDQS